MEEIIMKLDQDVIRNLLLELESQKDNSSLNEKQLREFSDDKGVDWKQLIYTIQRLNEARYIDSRVNYAGNDVYSVSINNITYVGHQFLDNIRDKNVWEMTKKRLSSIASVSLPIINEVALAVIKDKLGLQ